MGWRAVLREIERAERRKQKEREKEQKRLVKLEALQRANAEVTMHEDYINTLLSICKFTSASWDWEEVKSDPPISPKKSIMLSQVAQNNLKQYEPNLLDKILRRSEIKRQELHREIDNAVKKEKDTYQEELDEFEKATTIYNLAEPIITGDKNAYIEVLSLLNLFDAIKFLGSQVAVDVGSPTLAQATLKVNSNEVIPRETKAVLKSGKLSVKKMPITKFHALYQDYVCGAVLRVGRELFAYLPLEMVIVTAVSDMLNTKTGHMEESPLLSVVIPQKTLSKLNFLTLDPSDSMENFIHNMKFRKTKGFSPVDQLQVSDLNM